MANKKAKQQKGKMALSRGRYSLEYSGITRAMTAAASVAGPLTPMLAARQHVTAHPLAAEVTHSQHLHLFRCHATATATAAITVAVATAGRCCCYSLVSTWLDFAGFRNCLLLHSCHRCLLLLLLFVTPVLILLAPILLFLLPPQEQMCLQSALTPTLHAPLHTPLSCHITHYICTTSSHITSSGGGSSRGSTPMLSRSLA